MPVQKIDPENTQLMAIKYLEESQTNRTSTLVNEIRSQNHSESEISNLYFNESLNDNSAAFTREEILGHEERQLESEIESCLLSTQETDAQLPYVTQQS